MSAGALALAAGLAVLLIVAAAGCESSQDKSARLAKQAGPLAKQEGVTVTSANPDVRVVDTAVVTDANGSAVVVRLRNTSARAQGDVPVAVDVTDAAGKTVFTNATPGLERTLTHAALLPAKDEAVWVNDQVFATQPPRKVSAKVGPAEAKSPPAASSLRVSGVRLTEDPASGIAAAGIVTNTGDNDLRRVLLTGVARRGTRIVAAGRGVVARVRAGKRASFRIFFIGDPKGAKLSVTAGPSPSPSS